MNSREVMVIIKIIHVLHKSINLYISMPNK